MSKADSMKKLENLNGRLSELVSLSEIITYVLFSGEGDDVVKRHIAGAASVLTHNLSDMENEYLALNRAMQKAED